MCVYLQGSVELKEVLELEEVAHDREELVLQQLDKGQGPQRVVDEQHLEIG